MRAAVLLLALLASPADAQRFNVRFDPGIAVLPVTWNGQAAFLLGVPRTHPLGSYRAVYFDRPSATNIAIALRVEIWGALDPRPCFDAPHQSPISILGIDGGGNTGSVATCAPRPGLSLCTSAAQLEWFCPSWYPPCFPTVGYGVGFPSWLIPRGCPSPFAPELFFVIVTPELK